MKTIIKLLPAFCRCCRAVFLATAFAHTKNAAPCSLLLIPGLLHTRRHWQTRGRITVNYDVQKIYYVGKLVALICHCCLQEVWMNEILQQ